MKINRKTEGFTIIEVLIVLAIAGLIMLVVFLAVPALQRNSRNTQRKNDVSAILGGVSEYSGNNNGKIPTDATTTATAMTNVNLGYYDTVTWASGAQSALTTDTARLVTGAKCGPTGTTVVGSSRQVAVQFMSETPTQTATCQNG